MKKFTVRGIEWIGGFMNRSYTANVGDGHIQISRPDKATNWYLSYAGISEWMPNSAGLPAQDAARDAFDIAHLRTSNRCQAFQDALTVELEGVNGSKI